MSRIESTEPDPSAIGRVPVPPFARLPDPQKLFAARADRFRALAEGHELAPYLQFLADLCEAQAAIQQGLPEPDAIDPEALARAVEHKMPRIDRNQFVPDAAFEATLERLLSAAEGMTMPAVAREALGRVRGADIDARNLMLQNVMAEAIPVEALAEHVFIAAALQVHFTRLAAGLDAKTMESVGDGVCPSCGGAPSSTMVVHWPPAPGARYCACALCGTLWNYVRSKCTLCGSTKKITFQEIDGNDGVIKAETCEECRGYMKILNLQKERTLDPIADDVASLGLDLLVRETGFRRGGINPFLIGY